MDDGRHTCPNSKPRPGSELACLLLCSVGDECLFGPANEEADSEQHYLKLTMPTFDRQMKSFIRSFRSLLLEAYSRMTGRDKE
jgi:hypothetical protein